ncbi:unnamed protein product [Urochloa humidicola]
MPAPAPPGATSRLCRRVGEKDAAGSRPPAAALVESSACASERRGRDPEGERGRDEDGLPEKEGHGCAGEDGAARRPCMPAAAAAVRKERRGRRKCWAGEEPRGGPEVGPVVGQRRCWQRGSGRASAGFDHRGRMSAAAPARISARGVAGGGWPNQRRCASTRPSSVLFSPRAGCPFSDRAPRSPHLGAGCAHHHGRRLRARGRRAAGRFGRRRAGADGGGRAAPDRAKNTCSPQLLPRGLVRLVVEMAGEAEAVAAGRAHDGVGRRGRGGAARRRALRAGAPRRRPLLVERPRAPHCVSSVLAARRRCLRSR